MLEYIAIALVVLWLLSVVTGHTMGGYIHLLLLALIAMIVRFVRGDKPLA